MALPKVSHHHHGVLHHWDTYLYYYRYAVKCTNS